MPVPLASGRRPTAASNGGRAGFRRDDTADTSYSVLSSGGSAHPSYSCLGGWSLMINAPSSPEKQKAAWTLIQYLTAPAQQRRRAIDRGFLPTRTVAYEEPTVKEQAPGIVLSRGPVQHARVRPVSPYYMNLSPASPALHTHAAGRTDRGRSRRRAPHQPSTGTIIRS